MDHQLTKWGSRLHILFAKVKPHLPGLITPALIFCALLFPFIFSRPFSPKTASPPKFRQNLLRSGYSGTTGEIKTNLTVSPQHASVSVSRHRSTLSFDTPLENSTLNGNENLLKYTVTEKNIELHYQLTDLGIKEEIILNQAPSDSLFQSNLNLKNLSIFISPEGIPVFLDPQGNYQFHFQRPFAQDAAGNTTYALRYYFRDKDKKILPLAQIDNQESKALRHLFGKLTPLPASEYTLILEVDPDWLLSPDRQYPILIDPTVVHDTQTEFSSGSINRLSDLGLGNTTPALESAYQEYPLHKSTVLLWHFNETVASGLKDFSGYDHYAAATGTTSVAGVIGNARSFNGQSDHIIVQNEGNFNFPQITFALWVKPNTAHNGTIISKGDNTGYRLRLTSDLHFSILDRGSSNTVVSYGTYTPGNWYHLAVSGDSRGVRLYINGVLDKYSKTAYSGSINSSDIYLGKSFSFNEYFNGALDEFAVYNQALNPDEIRSLAQRRQSATYTSPVIDLDNVSSWNSLSWTSSGNATGHGETLANSSGLVAQWNFNESAGTSAASTAGSCTTACNMTISGIPNLSARDIGGTLSLSGWTSQNKRWGAGALMLDGLDDYLTIPPASASFKSFEFWVWPPRISSLSLLQFNTNLRITTDADGKITLDSGFILPEIYVNGSKSSRKLTANTWNHIAISTDYLNIIGTAYVSRVGTSYSPGIFDSFRLYNRPLTSAEVRSNYNQSNLEFLTRSSANGTAWDAWSGAIGNTQVHSFDSLTEKWLSSSGSLNYPPPIHILNTGQTTPSPPTNCTQSRLLLNNSIGNLNSVSGYGVETIVPFQTGMAADFSDIRFSRSSGTTMNYYLESYVASKYAIFWVSYSSDTPQTSNTYYLWYGGCSGSPSSSAPDVFFTYYNDFTGTSIDTSKITATATYVTQNNQLILTNNNDSWDVGAHTFYTYPRNPGLTFQAKVRTTTGGRSLIGWHDSGTSQNRASFIYGIYLNAGSLYIYQDDSGLDTTINYTEGTDLDIKIVLKNQGADYYYKPSSSLIWQKIYSSNYSAESNLRPAIAQFDAAEPTYTDNWRLQYELSQPQISEKPTSASRTEGSGSLEIKTGSLAPDPYTTLLLHLEESGTGLGTTFYDSSVHSNHGTGSTNFPQTVGFIDNGRQTQDNSVITLGTTFPARPTNNFTIEAWFQTNLTHQVDTEAITGTAGLDGQKFLFYPDSGENIGAGSTLYSGMGVSVGSNGISVYEETTNNHFPAYFAPIAVYNGQVPAGWNHLAVTYTNRVPRIYLNGRLVRTGLTSPKSLVFAPIRIGGGNNGSFEGKIDEIKISNISRDPQYITESYRSGSAYHLNYTISPVNLSNQKYLSFMVASDQPGTAFTFNIGESAPANGQTSANTLLLYHFDEDSGSDLSNYYLSDSSSYGGYANISGTSAPSFTVGKVGNARYFDGGDLLNLLSPSHLQSINNQTISLWLKPTDFSKRVNPICKAYGGEFCITQEIDGSLSYYYGTSGSNASPFQDFPNIHALTINQWNHIVVVRDLTNMKLRWYLNGRLTNENNASYAAAKAGSLPTYIGNGYTDNYIGAIDEVMITNTALSTSEIQQLYYTGTNSHPVNIDFKAKLESANLIIGSTDYTFQIDETSFGSSTKITHLNRNEKIIIKEKINDTTYIAQGEVSSLNRSTGLVTVASWDPSSIFPTTGFSANAIAYKWQQEFIDLSAIPQNNRDSITNLNLLLLNRQASTLWLDDLRTYSGFMNISTGSTISSTPRRYFQYKSIFTSVSPTTSTTLNSVTLDYQGAPSIPLIDNSHLHDSVKTNDSTPELRFTSSGNSGENLTYEVQWSTDSDFLSSTTANSSSQAGFSNTQTPSDTPPFNSGDKISYIFQSALSNNTTYFYRVRASNGSLWSSWSSIRSLTIDTSINLPHWYQTHADQFRLDNLSAGITISDSLNHIGVNQLGDSSGWIYKQSITITNPGSLLVNQDVLLSIDTAGLISTNKLQSDCDDLRFKTSNNTDIPYFLEAGCNSSTTQVWIRLAQFISGDNLIEMSYGNPSASSGKSSWSGKFTSPSSATCTSNWTTNADLDQRFPSGQLISGQSIYGVGGGASSHNHANLTPVFGNGAHGSSYSSDTADSPATRTHTHTASVPINISNHLPPYLTVFYCQTDNLILSPAQMLMFASTTPPSWTHISSLDNRFPLGSDSFGIVGGGDTHVHTTVQVTTSTTQTGHQGAGSNDPQLGQHTHTVSSATTSSASNLPPFQKLNFSSPQQAAYAPSDSIIITSALPPFGWTRYTPLDDRIPQGASSDIGGTGGANTHNHSVTLLTSYVSDTPKATGGGEEGDYASYHRHTGTLSTNYQSNLPPYLTVIFAQRKSSPFSYSFGAENSISGFGVANSNLITAADLEPSATYWHSFIFSDNENFGDIKYQIFYDDDGETVLVPDSDLPGNSSGFDTSPVSLTSLSTSQYPSIYLNAQFQYDEGSPILNDWAVTLNRPPEIPSLDTPVNSASNLSLTPLFKTTTTDGNGDYLLYKIEICTDSSMTLGCLTYDQTASQIDWSGQNTQSSTAYNSGTQANFTPPNPLSPGTTYYWRSSAIDPAGTNHWGQSQTSPNSFTTASLPNAPTRCLIDESFADSLLHVHWQDNATDENNYEIRRSINSDPPILIQTLSAGTTGLSDITAQNNSYIYQIRATKSTSDNSIVYSPYCSTSRLNLNQGDLNFDGINLDGLNIN